MQSVIQRESYGSVKVFWLNKELLNEQIDKIAAKLAAENPQVKEIILFGSLAENKATAFSDIDIAIIVSDTSERFIDRQDKFINYFQGLGLDIDIFVYTEKELEQKNDFVNLALAKGKRIGC